MSEMEHLSGVEGRKKIAGLIKGIHICMMTTAASDGSFDSRPMATQTDGFDGTVYFLTRHESGKVKELAHDRRIGLMFADTSNSKYVTAKGTGEVVQDKAKIEELWNPMFTAWFPGGKDDPSVAVLKVEIEEAHYWEASASKLVVMAKYAVAAVTHGGVDVGTQGEVKL
jgi:general stress protein 26